MSKNQHYVFSVISVPNAMFFLQRNFFNWIEKGQCNKMDGRTPVKKKRPLTRSREMPAGHLICQGGWQPDRSATPSGIAFGRVSKPVCQTLWQTEWLRWLVGKYLLQSVEVTAFDELQLDRKQTDTFFVVLSLGLCCKLHSRNPFHKH